MKRRRKKQRSEVSDVVTGQVDVRNVEIPVYETEMDIIDSEDDSDEENPDESMEE